jgi:acyl-CoA thioester hydrolase
MQFQGYHHVIPIQIRFKDTDRIGHVNNANYLTYFEQGRVDYFNHVFEHHINWATQGFVLARTELNHLLPVFLQDSIYVATRVSKLGNKSLTIENVLFKEQNNEIKECANGLGVLVAMNYTNHQSIEIPELWRNLISHYETKEL